MSKIEIIIENSNQCQLKGDTSYLKNLFDKFKFKHHNAFHIMQYSRSKWDGTVKYINQYGKFKVGLLNMVYNEALKLTDSVKIIDNRPKLPFKPVIPDKVGNLTLRDVQKKSLKRLLFNKVGGVPFLICSANLAVNFGKTLIFSAIHQAFKGELKTLLLLNDSDLFEQFKKELPLLLGNDIAFIRGKVDKWAKFNVAMVPSLARNLDFYRHQLSTIDITLIDEADIIDNKTFKTVLEHLYQTKIRIGLSGTLYKGKLKKDLIPNMNIRSFIGDMVDDVKLSDQIKRGQSTKTIIKSITLNFPVTPKLTYEQQYREVIIDNPKAYDAILSRIKYNLPYKRLPMLIATKFIDHTDRLEVFLKKNLPNLRVVGLHHKTKDRDKILDTFREGKIDILIATTIISRGKNIPLLKYTCNASSMDAEEKTIQLVGRSVRLHKSKNKAIIDDLIFPGNYLKRHGNHRKNYYIRENLKVINVPRRKKNKKK